MIDRIIKNKVKVRTLIFVFLTFLAYGFTIFYLFGLHDIFASIVCVFFLFVFFHFMSLDIKKIKTKYIILILLSLTILDVTVLLLSNWEINIWLILSIITLNWSLFALFTSLKVVQFSSISYFLRWWYIFTLLITATYSIALVWMFQRFPLTCDWLQEASNKLIDFVEKPFVVSVEKIDDWTNLEEWTVFDLDKKLDDDMVENALNKFKNTEIKIDNSENNFSKIVYQFNEWKNNSVEQIMSQQENYNISMCDMLLEEINAKYNLKEFSLSVIILIYLLLFGFVRVAIFVMSFIWFLVFKILYWSHLYKIKKVKKEVDEIK